jgi:glycosyltransferase involved in cell wall biosynthesis
VWSEPFGLVAIEAMASGVPVLASRIGGLLDIVDEGVSGLLVPPGDALALRDGIERLLDNPNLRLTLGSQARCKVKEFFASAVLPRIEEVYRDVIAKHESVEFASIKENEYERN